ncbi:uncharacterized protein BDZ99DRAFT_468146 [Mytilinidion resinicola]|uniref:Uncharacterized protein n=1 Tax=Mytilinidion resinicola TaxID=574789 RepID=A0A6A6Y4R2_9PEZI|nr:uncharacterized protein BDZ99DRAFT_468146 [Mytilinidion resinicola]KAF2803619.1 hypothetical protein BDZ99DRAFT_468146 [Mytilinidion resinicola]
MATKVSVKGTVHGAQTQDGPGESFASEPFPDFTLISFHPSIEKTSSNPTTALCTTCSTVFVTALNIPPINITTTFSTTSPTAILTTLSITSPTIHLLNIASATTQLHPAYVDTPDDQSTDRMQRNDVIIIILVCVFVGALAAIWFWLSVIRNNVQAYLDRCAADEDSMNGGSGGKGGIRDV